MKEADSGCYSDFALYDIKHNDRYQTSRILIQNIFLPAQTVIIAMSGLTTGYSRRIITCLSEASWQSSIESKKEMVRRRLRTSNLNDINT
jgi:hypothetical protein